MLCCSTVTVIGRSLTLNYTGGVVMLVHGTNASLFRHGSIGLHEVGMSGRVPCSTTPTPNATDFYLSGDLILQRIIFPTACLSTTTSCWSAQACSTLPTTPSYTICDSSSYDLHTRSPSVPRVVAVVHRAISISSLTSSTWPFLS